MSHLLVEQLGHAAPEKQTLHELWTLCHGLQLPSRKLFQFDFGFRLMARKLLMFQVVPDFFVRIPVRGVLRGVA